MSTQTLVIGATGQIGSTLVKLLSEQGKPTLAATRTTDSFKSLPHITPVHMSLDDPSTFAKALEGTTHLFVMCPAGHADAHRLLHPFLKTALSSASIQRVVTMTARGVDASDQIPLRRVELEVEKSGKPYIHLRPTWFMQNFNSYWLPQLQQHQTLLLPAGNAGVPFIDIQDIAKSALAALHRDDIKLNQAYILTGPQVLTHAQVASLLSQVSQTQIDYKHTEDEDFVSYLTGLGLSEDYTGLLVALFAVVRSGAEANTTPDVETLTGHPPSSFLDYAKTHAQIFQAATR